MEAKITQNDILFRHFQMYKFQNKRIVPTVSMTVNVDISKAIALKNKMNKTTRITITHVVMKAVANTLINFPILYSFCNGKKIIQNKELILNIPVDIENHVEYITIHKPEQKTLFDISKECEHELEKIHKGKGTFLNLIKPLDKIYPVLKLFQFALNFTEIGFLRKYYGNFPLSNFGSLHVNNGTLALSQPMISGLCLGKIVPIIQEKQSKFVKIINLPLTISFDHRAVDGAYAAKFLNEVKNLLENPDIIFCNTV